MYDDKSPLLSSFRNFRAQVNTREENDSRILHCME